jgi:hypothetical protein
MARFSHWPHDELDMAPEPLYEAAREHPLVRAAAATP